MSNMSLRGAALFGFIPLVLWLFLAQPLGPGFSLAIGIAVMAGHRAVAAPWAARHARERCLWCGRSARVASEVAVTSRAGIFAFGVCDGRHEDAVRRFFGFVDAHRTAIRLGIFVPLALLLGGTLLRALGLPSLTRDVNAMQFRLVVAATVVLTSVAYTAGPPALSPRSVFPAHNLFLLGIRNTLWVFRIVGGWWLLAAAWQVARLAAR